MQWKRVATIAVVMMAATAMSAAVMGFADEPGRPLSDAEMAATYGGGADEQCGPIAACSAPCNVNNEVTACGDVDEAGLCFNATRSLPIQDGETIGCTLAAPGWFCDDNFAGGGCRRYWLCFWNPMLQRCVVSGGGGTICFNTPGNCIDFEVSP